MDEKRDFIFSKNISQKEVIKLVNDMFKQHWYRDYSYIKQRPKEMQSSKIPQQIKTKHFVDLFYYLNYLVDTTTHGFTFQHIENDQVRKEVQHWEREGGYCIYMSILFYGLVTKLGWLDKAEIAYYQGYYDFKGNQALAAFIPAFERQIGVHAWLCINNSVIDLTANQNANTFDGQISKMDIILGEYNKGYKLVGYKETDTTIAWYMQQFSGFVGMTVEEWLDFHCQQALEFILTKIPR